jgi:TetR/AcrR family transcriptional repressor of nem operon
MTIMKLGRPNKFDRSQAVETAKKAFWKQGYNALTASKLASIMGITRSSFANSFSDKRGLFTEVLALYKQTEPYIILVNIDELALIKPKLTEFFKEVCRTRIHDQGKHGCLIVNTISEVIGSDDMVANDMENLMISSIELFENLLKRAVSNKELPSDYKVNITAKALVTFNMGLSNLSKVLRDEQQLWEVCEDFLITHQLT